MKGTADRGSRRTLTCLTFALIANVTSNVPQAATSTPNVAASLADTDHPTRQPTLTQTRQKSTAPQNTASIETNALNPAFRVTYVPAASHPATPRQTRSTTTAGRDSTPLLTYAAAHHFPPIFSATAQIDMQRQVMRITLDLAKDPPPATNCAQTLGARRFATLYDDLGQVYSNQGEQAKAAEAYAKALDCNPRADFLHAQLAAGLLDLGRYDEARAEIQRQLHLGRADFALYTIITQLDFIEDRWPDAVHSATIAVIDAPDDQQATYWQCFHWLAQMHAGTAEPALAQRLLTDTWPAPVLEFLQGKITEADVLAAVDAEPDVRRRRDILSEALFYTGQQRLATHDVDEAVRYFTATVNLQVIYFIEHQLALAELKKLRAAAGGAAARIPKTIGWTWPSGSPVFARRSGSRVFARRDMVAARRPRRPGSTRPDLA